MGTPRFSLILPILMGVIAAMMSPRAIPEDRANLQTLLPEFELRFDLIHEGIFTGHAVLRLQRQARGRWEYTRLMTTAGVIGLFRSDTVEETSHGHDRERRMQPVKYVYHRGGDRPRKVVVTFDWPNGRARNTLGNRSWRMKIPDHALDKLSVELALMNDLRMQGGKPSPGRAWTYPVADGGALKNYRFEVQGEEVLESPVGPVETLLIIRTRQHDTQRTRYWMAPDLGYLLVRIERLLPGGETARMELTGLEVGGDT